MVGMKYDDWRVNLTVGMEELENLDLQPGWRS